MIIYDKCRSIDRYCVLPGALQYLAQTQGRQDRAPGKVTPIGTTYAAKTTTHRTTISRDS